MGEWSTYTTREVRHQAVGFLRELPIDSGKSLVVKVAPRVGLLDLLHSLRVPEAVEVQSHDPCSVVPFDIEERADRHEDLCRGRVTGRPLQRVEHDALHYVTELVGIEVGGRGVQLLVSHAPAVELKCHRMSRVIKNLRDVQPAQVMEQGGVIEAQRQLLEPNLRQKICIAFPSDVN
jgi:hypothetical protein